MLRTQEQVDLSPSSHVGVANRRSFFEQLAVVDAHKMSINRTSSLEYGAKSLTLPREPENQNQLDSPNSNTNDNPDMQSSTPPPPVLSFAPSRFAMPVSASHLPRAITVRVRVPVESDEEPSPPQLKISTPTIQHKQQIAEKPKPKPRHLNTSSFTTADGVRKLRPLSLAPATNDDAQNAVFRRGPDVDDSFSTAQLGKTASTSGSSKQLPNLSGSTSFSADPSATRSVDRTNLNFGNAKALFEPVAVAEGRSYTTLPLKHESRNLLNTSAAQLSTSPRRPLSLYTPGPRATQPSATGTETIDQTETPSNDESDDKPLNDGLSGESRASRAVEAEKGSVLTKAKAFAARVTSNPLTGEELRLHNKLDVSRTGSTLRPLSITTSGSNPSSRPQSLVFPRERYGAAFSPSALSASLGSSSFDHVANAELELDLDTSTSDLSKRWLETQVPEAQLVRIRKAGQSWFLTTDVYIRVPDGCHPVYLLPAAGSVLHPTGADAVDASKRLASGGGLVRPAGAGAASATQLVANEDAKERKKTARPATATAMATASSSDIPSSASSSSGAKEAPYRSNPTAQKQAESIPKVRTRATDKNQSSTDKTSDKTTDKTDIRSTDKTSTSVKSRPFSEVIARPVAVAIDPRHVILTTKVSGAFVTHEDVDDNPFIRSITPEMRALSPTQSALPQRQSAASTANARPSGGSSEAPVATAANRQQKQQINSQTNSSFSSTIANAFVNVTPPPSRRTNSPRNTSSDMSAADRFASRSGSGSGSGSSGGSRRQSRSTIATLLRFGPTYLFSEPELEQVMREAEADEKSGGGQKRVNFEFEGAGVVPGGRPTLKHTPPHDKDIDRTGNSNGNANGYANANGNSNANGNVGGRSDCEQSREDYEVQEAPAPTPAPSSTSQNAHHRKSLQFVDEPTTFAYESEQSLLNKLLDQRSRLNAAYALPTSPPAAAAADADALEYSSSNSGLGLGIGLGIEPPLSPTSGLFPISRENDLGVFFGGKTDRANGNDSGNGRRVDKKGVRGLVGVGRSAAANGDAAHLRDDSKVGDEHF